MQTWVKSLGSPDEVLRLPGIVEELVDLGDLTVGRVVHDPGWRWSTHVKPIVKTEWCQETHIGYIISGRMAIRMQDGTERVFGPDEVHVDRLVGHHPQVLGDLALHLDLLFLCHAR
mgnify:CR=1 FL=1